MAGTTLTFPLFASNPPSDWIVRAISDQPQWLEANRLALSSTKTNWLLTIMAPATAGAARITVIAVDAQQRAATNSFVVAVCRAGEPQNNWNALQEAVGMGPRYASPAPANLHFAPGEFEIGGTLRTTHDGQSFYGDAPVVPGDIPSRLVFHLPPGGIAWGIGIEHSGCSSRNLEIRSIRGLPTEYLVLLRSRQMITNNTIARCQFSGGAGNFLRDEAKGTAILENRFYSSLAHHVMEGVSINNDPGFVVAGNRFSEIAGFSLKVRGTGVLPGAASGRYSSGVIASNVFSNTLSRVVLPYVPGQADYLFSNMAHQTQVALWVGNNQSNQCWGLWGGSWRQPAALNWRGEARGPEIAVHLNHLNIIPPGSQLTLLGWNSLEHVNIDGGSTNIVIRNNSFLVTGDSAITVCNDFKVEWPAGIACVSNYFQDVACAGINFQEQRGGCSAQHNRFLRTGLSNIGAHYDATRREWNGQTPWSTCIFDAASGTEKAVDFGDVKGANHLLADPFSPACTRTANNRGFEDPWGHANPF